MSRNERPYLSYLLRLWQEETGEAWSWRASLESAHTGRRHGFASLKLLFAFLEGETAGTEHNAITAASVEWVEHGPER